MKELFLKFHLVHMGSEIMHIAGMDERNRVTMNNVTINLQVPRYRSTSII